MTRALLDVNVLLALFDSDHVAHDQAVDWLDIAISDGWASCPITENGFVRIISQPRYPSPVSPATAIGLLDGAQTGEHHEFWPCEVSVADPGRVDRSRLHGPRQVTDAYLLALAVARGGRLATFDQSISLDSVPGATASHLAVI